jgi:hypothetical protein
MSSNFQIHSLRAWIWEFGCPHVDLHNPLRTPFPLPLIMAFFCHFLSPVIEKFINATMITPANVAPPPVHPYNLLDLKHVKDDQTAYLDRPASF